MKSYQNNLAQRRKAHRERRREFYFIWLRTISLQNHIILIIYYNVNLVELINYAAILFQRIIT